MADLASAKYPQTNAAWAALGSPTVYGETVPKVLAGTDVAIAATGVEQAVQIVLDAGTVVTNINFVTGGTAAGTPTAGYAVLRDSAGNKLVQTADFTTTARAANTAYAVALSSAYTVPYSGVYRIGISFTAATVPTLRGVSLGNAALTAAGGTSPTVTHGSSVAGTAPATVSSPTAATTIPYFFVS